jgi:hypothetical protein
MAGIVDEIQRGIVKCWKRTQRLEVGNREWTRLTFECLQNIGRRHGYESRYKGARSAGAEWMWDLVWLERDRSGCLARMRLAVESEWTPRGVLNDFEKLLAADADLRLVIFQASKEASFHKALDDMKTCTRRYRGRPAHYLVACWLYGVEPIEPRFESWKTRGTR